MISATQRHATSLARQLGDHKSEVAEEFPSVNRFLWTQIDDVGPPPRRQHTMCFDPIRKRILLFGGRNDKGVLFRDTWERGPDDWTQVSDIGPGKRFGHAICHGGAQVGVLLFGGMDAAGFLGDTWQWKDGVWVQIEDSGPSRRFAHSMAYDLMRNRVVLFGGESSEGVQNDTWEWDPVTSKWTQVADGGPLRRANASMAYDRVFNRLVLFGGDDRSGDSFGDTWVFDQSGWIQVAHFGAPPCSSGALVGTDVQLTSFGGVQQLAPPRIAQVLSGTWAFGEKFWTQRQDMGPSPRWGHAMAFDLTRRTLALFGGSASLDEFGDTNGETWEHLETDPSAMGARVAAIEIASQAYSGAPFGLAIRMERISLYAVNLSVKWIENPSTTPRPSRTSTTPRLKASARNRNSRCRRANQGFRCK